MTTHLISKPDLLPIPYSSTRLPHALELTVLLREFIHYWAGLGTTLPECRSLSTLSNPVEYATRWSGSVKGTLVLRSSRAFQENLVRIFREKGSAVPPANVLFQEMATLYSIFLVHYAWMDELFELGPILARPSQPSQWPSGEPHAFCSVEVEGEPVEIRLWIGGPSAAGSGEKKPKGGLS